MPNAILGKRGKEIMSGQEVRQASTSARASSQQSGDLKSPEDESLPIEATADEKASSPAPEQRLRLQCKRRQSEKVRSLKTAFKTNESRLKSEGLRRVQILADLEARDTEVTSLSSQLQDLQKAHAFLRTDLADITANLSASTDREATLQKQLDVAQATLKYVQAKLSVAKVETTAASQELAKARDDTNKDRKELKDY
ncbi:fibrinogen- and Ig-binding protein-like [Zingiber officinale]|uniref:fibrinogen- and Ig-binding protein-like n=1 Tax=Zingiber officinale TaxID=94328 RepID=UPI001C4AEAE3|nr:fibrinogen- and Ig-binding protein-like [Zingiber officinale]